MFCPSTPARLYSLANDVYARESVTAVGNLPVLIAETNAWSRTPNQQALDADAIAMVLPKDLQALVTNGRVEGMLLQIDPFTPLDWFRIDSVSVAKDLLLCNKVRHYELGLTRSKEPKNVCGDEES